MLVAETPRLRLRWLNGDDAGFILELLNDPDWIANIGDRGLRDLDGARQYIETGPQAMYANKGFGLNLVELHDRTPVGLCGLLRRENLPDVDVGYAFMPSHRGKGYAREAVTAILADAHRSFGLARVIAITKPHNVRSAKLLTDMGFVSEGTIPFVEGAPEASLFGIELSARAGGHAGSAPS